MENEAVETEEHETEVLEEVEELEAEQPQGEQEEGTETEAEADQVVVTIGDESPASEEEEQGQAPEWVKNLRKERRELIRENRELKAKQQQTQPAQAVTVGAKPTLEGADYDAETFEKQLTEWHERKRQADEEDRKKKDAVEADQKAWAARREAYGTQKSALKVADYEDAEAQALDFLSVTQQAVILQGAENAAVVVYALGKNPAKAKQLAEITDPVKFAFAVAKLETQMKVLPKKVAPLPETKVSGSGRTAVSGDTKLAALEAKADKTGDRTELVNYKRAQKLKRAA